MKYKIICKTYETETNKLIFTHEFHNYRLAEALDLICKLTQETGHSQFLYNTYEYEEEK